MTDLLQKAFTEASKLPSGEQDALGAWILDELATERRWDAAFERSADRLSDLADEAMAEHRQGKSQPLDPERL